MKNLSFISFVGVDEHTNLENLKCDNFDKSILCEWSILYSDSKSIGNYIRYPSYDFCNKFLECGGRSMDCSLHLCGSVIDRYLKQDKDIINLTNKAYRIQLNINIDKFPDYEKLSDDILTNINKYGHKIILQQNKTKKKFMEVFLNKTNKKISLLHDGSGGFGRVITQTDQPHDFHITGYAGGINPENVTNIVELIEKNNPNNKPYYIDMESGVRENNVFSIEKCQQVIKKLIKT